MIRHHPSPETLLAAAAGTLPSLHARVLAVHLAACESCRRTIRLAEEIGGVVLVDLPPAPLAEGALDRVLGRLEAAEMPALPSAPPVTLEGLATGHWRWFAPGIHVMPLVARDPTGTRLDLIRVRPGIGLPAHGHRGMESVTVLQGSFADESGQYHVGDFAEGDAGFDHQPVGLPGDDCICLMATTGYLRAHNWLARIIQPLYGV
jgi:putative transcriptional regulator